MERHREPHSGEYVAMRSKVSCSRSAGTNKLAANSPSGDTTNQASRRGWSWQVLLECDCRSNAWTTSTHTCTDLGAEEDDCGSGEGHSLVSMACSSCGHGDGIAERNGCCRFSLTTLLLAEATAILLAACVDNIASGDGLHLLISCSAGGMCCWSRTPGRQAHRTYSTDGCIACLANGDVIRRIYIGI